MFSKLRAYPMIVLLLPLVAAILLFDHFVPRTVFPEESLPYAFVVEREAKPTAKCERYDAALIAQWDSTCGQWKEVRENVLLYLLRDSLHAMPVVGDTIVAHTTIETYRRMHKAFAAQWTTYPTSQATRIPLQKRLYQRLAATGLNGDELTITGALTLGYKEDLDPEVKHHFQASGAAHVLAVSGLHTGILYGLVLWLITLGGRIRPRYENRWGRWAISLIIIAVMWGYAWLTGMTPSVVRAVIMVTMVEVAHMCYRQALSLNTIAAAAVLILLVHPSDLWSVSFQLSFSATAAIVVVARNAEKLFHSREWDPKWLGRIASWLLGTVIISIAAQVGTLPITMYYFGQISNYFLLTNLIVLPLATLLVPCGLVTMVLGGCWAGQVMGKITYWLAWAMHHSVEWIENLPGSTTQVQIGPWMVAIYYLILLFFAIYLIKTDDFLQKNH